MGDLTDRLRDPHRRLTVSDRQEAAIAIDNMHAALLLARTAMLRETADAEQDALSAIDAVLGDPAISTAHREERS